MGRDSVGGLVHERVGAWVDGWMVVVVAGGEEKAVPRVRKADSRIEKGLQF